MEKAKNRIEWIVILRAFACMAVVFFHVIITWIDYKTMNVWNGRYFLDKVILD